MAMQANSALAKRIGWCPRPESNRHSLRNSILSRARLPIPPRGHAIFPYRRAKRAATARPLWERRSGEDLVERLAFGVGPVIVRPARAFEEHEDDEGDAEA